ncbi:C-X-C motif chemokine 5-like isoform X2 [Melanotaenia boesemani]|uniref:C-X-C motif chemokine 5-like isoform X2 n=1 Tax=Melanotaenia boesemani TaxID=1250792 RepID=UPI001C0474C2|nr:C-X-C motif chemokine 5-like isoform X2 [Melanotaenia boesemani]
MSYITIVALLVIFTIPEVSSEGDPGAILRCRCLIMETRPIGRHIGMVEVSRPSSHCNHTEIIAVLKKGGKKVCLDPDAPWVKKVLKHLGEKP